MTVKVVTVFESNLGRGLPSHLATIGLYDAETGACRAFIDGTYITAVRTSAAAAVACDVLAREDARVLTIVGAGVQGEQHLRTFPLVRGFDEIRISSLVHEDAERLAAADPRARAVRARGGRARSRRRRARHPCRAPGDRARLDRARHARQLGRLPAARGRAAARADVGRLFVETREAFAPTPVGCAELAGRDPASATELGEVLLGRAAGRRDAEEITVYKAMGHVVEDIVAAELVYAAAQREAAGVLVEL